MKNSDLAAVVVLYNPPVEELKANLASYLNEVGLLVLDDNSDDPDPEIKKLVETSGKILYFSM